MLSKPAPAPQAPKPITVPSSQVSHKLFVPGTAFKPDFGKPVQPLQAGGPMKMATLPPGAGSPNPMPKLASAPTPVAQSTAAPVHHAASSSVPHHHNAHVSGKLRTPTAAHGESATPIAAYSTGYVPGGSLPAQSGAGMNTNTNVSGVLKTKIQH